MPNELYFLQLIRAAIDSERPRQRLEQAFAQIERLAGEAGYQIGYEQFCRWWAEASAEIARLEGTELASVATYQQMPELRVVLFRDDKPVNTQPVGFEATGIFTGLGPGNYRLELDNGRLLWQRLRKEQLLWSAAFPGKPLRLAAATPEQGEPDTDTVRDLILDEQWRVRVHPGLESGRMWVEPVSEP
jgi:hypothetical protein